MPTSAASMLATRPVSMLLASIEWPFASSAASMRVRSAQNARNTGASATWRWLPVTGASRASTARSRTTTTE